MKKFLILGLCIWVVGAVFCFKTSKTVLINNEINISKNEICPATDVKLADNIYVLRGNTSRGEFALREFGFSNSKRSWLYSYILNGERHSKSRVEHSYNLGKLTLVQTKDFANLIIETYNKDKKEFNQYSVRNCLQERDFYDDKKLSKNFMYHVRNFA